MDSIAQIATTLDAKHSRHFIKIVAATAAIAGLLFGFDTGVISGGILFIAGSILCAVAPGVEILIIGRIAVIIDGFRGHITGQANDCDHTAAEILIVA
jgi:hypothetical protein